MADRGQQLVLCFGMRLGAEQFMLTASHWQWSEFPKYENERT